MRPIRRISVLALIPLVCALNLCPIARADSHDLPAIALEIPDLTVAANSPDAWLTLRLANFFDTVAGIQMVIRLDRPDLVWFDLSDADFDTAASLLSGYEMVIGKDTAADHSAYKLFGIANLPFGGPETPGFAPQYGATLIRLPIATAAEPDPASGLSCTVEILPAPIFSDPNGQVIGYAVVDTVTDTIYYHCASWNGDQCLSWITVDPDSSSYDSIYVYDYYVEGPDPSLLILGTGTITIDLGGPLNCDLTADGSYSVSDLTCLVNYLFRTPGSGCPSIVCDCDASGNPPSQPNVADLTCLVFFLFRGGPPPSP